MRAHKHQCPKCNHIWEHNDPTGDESREVYSARHRCEKCSTEQFDKYFAPDSPEAFMRELFVRAGLL